MSRNITVNGVEYDVELMEIKIQGDFLYKYFERTQSGDTKTEAIGFFENQVLGFGYKPDNDFVALYEELSTKNSEGNYNKTIEVFAPTGIYTFEMYPDMLHIDMKRLEDDDTAWWGVMLVTFTATSKRR
jgi:hypothetical protein